MSPTPTQQLPDAETLNKIRHILLTGDVPAFMEAIKNYKIDHDTEFGQGDTMLHLAVRSGSFEMVEAVLKNVQGIDFSKQNRRGNTALCQAVQSAKPNTTKHQDEAVRKELREKYTKIALCLIDHDPDINHTAHLKNLMRKSAFDYLSKSVRILAIKQALDQALTKQVARESHITLPGVKYAPSSQHPTAPAITPTAAKAVRTR